MMLVPPLDRGRPFRAGRGSTATSCRSTSSSASFDADDRASSAIQLVRRTNIRYSIRTVTNSRSCQPRHPHRWKTRRSATYARFGTPVGDTAAVTAVAKTSGRRGKFPAARGRSPAGSRCCPTGRYLSRCSSHQRCSLCGTSDACRSAAERRFSLTRMALDYQRLYRRILSGPGQLGRRSASHATERLMGATIARWHHMRTSDAAVGIRRALGEPATRGPHDAGRGFHILHQRTRRRHPARAYPRIVRPGHTRALALGTHCGRVGPQYSHSMSDLRVCRRAAESGRDAGGHVMATDVHRDPACGGPDGAAAAWRRSQGRGAASCTPPGRGLAPARRHSS